MKHSHPIILGAGLLALATQAQAQQRPNVIVLVADDLGYGDLSCYGANRVSTPRVDSLRRPGTDIATGDAGLIIRPDRYTLARLFQDNGYVTAAIGKWHLGLGNETGKQDWNKKLDLGLDAIGFDYSYIMAATADRVPCVYIENGEVVNYDSKNFSGEPTGANNPELLTKLKSSHGHNQAIVNGIGRIGYMKGGGKALWRDEDIADTILTSAVRFMEENANKPFFMYLCNSTIRSALWPTRSNV